jgi:hypothetical protein
MGHEDAQLKAHGQLSPDYLSKVTGDSSTTTSHDNNNQPTSSSSSKSHGTEVGGNSAVYRWYQR